MKFSHNNRQIVPHQLSFNKLIPNILTMLALCSGMTSIRFGLHEKWDFAIISILISGIIDGLDGRIARLLHSTSTFGAQLDSLSDFISFGIAPAILIYFWTMQSAGGLGWTLVLVFSACCALRLARFNTMLGKHELPPWAHNFFIGVPAPAAANLVLLPMVLSFQSENNGFFTSTSINAIVLIVVSFLMVSKIPTYSGKNFKIPHDYVLPTLLLVSVLVASLVTDPWTTIATMGIIYAISIPISALSFYKFRKKNNQSS
ncbi:MAG: CDP-diacylglycerol--serine O-phosphatidyltransferase [Rhodospirillaceae bacterium]|jgi:CDP-diacylglycerol--serine O-phosphatidyltransferase|nr:CDP-diacylglycerol--serine O-phosphatidyltransferase [Rhodospirillaceae bacterium]